LTICRPGKGEGGVPVPLTYCQWQLRWSGDMSSFLPGKC